MATAGVPPPILDPTVYNPNQNPYVLGGVPVPGTPAAPVNSSVYGPGYAYSPYSGSQAGNQGPAGAGDPDTSQAGFTPSGNEADVTPGASPNDYYAANFDTENTSGNLIGQEAGNELGYYGQLQSGYTGATNSALNQLAATPGYTAAQAAAIYGNPNAPVSTEQAGVGQENTALNQYGQDASSQLQQTEGWQGQAAQEFGTGVTGAAQQYGAGVTGAASGLGTGLQTAQQGFTPLTTAVTNPNLQVSNQDVQNIVTAAGTTVGNQFQTAEDTLMQQAAAAGNTSPEATAAARQQLVTQEAATAGDTMTQAQIAAQQYQLGAEQQQTGMEATAYTTEEAAAQAAAAEAGLANIGAEEQIGSNTQQAAEQVGANTQAVAGTESAQALNEANTYGQFNVGQENTETGQNYGAGLTAEQAGTTQATTIANQAIAGQGAYRSGVAAAGGAAQTGGATALGAQNTTYGTQTSGENSTAQGASQYQLGSEALSLPNKLETSVANLFDTGTTALPGDTIAKVAGNGPEMIVPSKTSQVTSLMKEGIHGRYRGPKKRIADDMWQAA